MAAGLAGAWLAFAVMWGGLQQVWELFEKVQAELSRAKLADEI